MSQAAIVSSTRDGEVAVITVDNPPVNTITAAVRAGLAAALAEIERQLQAGAAEAPRAVLLHCAGKTSFSGADIGEFSGPPKEAEYRALFARFEALPVPVTMAIHGTVLGGGLEISLACHYRVAAREAKLGLPEVTLGIIPGAGGTQRLPRLIGAEKALDLIISARPVAAQQALEAGFIDAVIDGDLLTGALAFVRGLLKQGKGVRRTRDLLVDPGSATAAVFAHMRERARREYPNREAALTAIEAVQASLTLPLDQGLLLEERLANRSKATPESHGAIHMFFAERESRRVRDLPPGAKARPVRAAGIVGSGTMGGGIAMCFANAGLPVTVLDSEAGALARGLETISRNYDSMVKRGRIDAAEKARRMGLIRGTLDYAELSHADVVIEAVFENMDLKRRIFGTLDRVMKPGAVLASNTSTLNVSDIARATARPQDVIGMHFFAPANVMPLLEVVRTDLTSPETIQTVMELSRPLRKTPVLARVCYGFIGNRMMEGYAREAQRMVLEGATPRQVDTVLEQWGMAMGILAVFDMAGVDVGVNVHKANAERYPPDPTYYQADLALAEAGRLGQKTGKGYYRYVPGDRTRHDDPEALALLRQRAQQLEVPQQSHSQQEILERCLLPLINEGFRILEEGVAQRASDIDVVWCAGYGFPRYRGGPLFYAESAGLASILEGIERYRRRYGDMHWQPAGLLVDLVQRRNSIADWERERG
ncbi:MAG: 3-hydroxyacyl-CoA dehydrogenase NAD-binding domain-containing protein [Steroidobacteraceae bacterium]